MLTNVKAGSRRILKFASPYFTQRYTRIIALVKLTVVGPRV
jgi:hypothetical protein